MIRLPVFKKFFPVFLFCYHSLFAFVAWDYVTKNNGDAFRYWFVGQDLYRTSWLSFFQPGTDVIKIITFPLVKYFHLPFWAGFLLFSLFSFYGFYRLWRMVLSLSQYRNSAFCVGVILLLLPNLHLWTSFIGKEAVLFLALVLMVEQLLAQRLRSKTLRLSFLLIALIRPHVAIVLLISILIAYFWKGKSTGKAKFQLAMISVVGFLGLFFVLKKVAFIYNNPWERIVHIYDYHIKGLKKTDAYVPLDEYSWPYKIFTFYYRPLPLEKTGLFYHIWSFENLFLLLLTLAVLFLMVSNFKTIKWDFYEIFTIFAMLLFATMYVYAYANYGLIARTKIMVMPFLYLLMVKILSQTGKAGAQ